MSVKFGKAEIFDVRADCHTLAELSDGITERHLGDFESKWHPILYQHAIDTRLKCTNSDGKLNKQLLIDELGNLNIQDAGWDWRKKLQKHPQPSLYYKFISLECGGVTQGLMAIDLGNRLCRINSQLNQHLVYIDYLSVAPWNRPQLTNSPFYKKIGRVLMATAVSASLGAGFNGRIGLHSLPQANEFYERKCNMTSLGIDADKEYLAYFEMTGQQAELFLAD